MRDTSIIICTILEGSMNKSLLSESEVSALPQSEQGCNAKCVTQVANRAETREVELPIYLHSLERRGYKTEREGRRIFTPLFC